MPIPNRLPVRIPSLAEHMQQHVPSLVWEYRLNHTFTRASFLAVKLTVTEGDSGYGLEWTSSTGVVVPLSGGSLPDLVSVERDIRDRLATTITLLPPT